MEATTTMVEATTTTMVAVEKCGGWEVWLLERDVDGHVIQNWVSSVRVMVYIRI